MKSLAILVRRFEMLIQFIVVFLSVLNVNGHNTKGSLTFVIDNTSSMSEDIEQVKNKTDEVFDAVLNSNASIIDDFIIVTFNDPDAKFQTITKDRNVFKKALAEIEVDGGGDCPEYALKGIELALKKSKPNSLFYVLTDAAAKDYEDYDRVKNLGLNKSIQVSFLLTGVCKDGSPEKGNTVYDKLAAATNGQVFHIGKKDIEKIINYIIASIDHKKTTLARKSFESDKNKFQFSVDSKLWNVLISVSGETPTFHITGPDGNTVETKNFIDTENSYVFKLEAKPGVYTMYLDSIDPTSAAITGSTSVCFQHGFYKVQPNSLNETSTIPVADSPTYLSIVLDNIAKDVLLDTVEIRDINDNIISEFPLTLIDKNQQFYVTKSLLTPSSTFKLAINGHTKSKEKITRVASTTIEPQKLKLELPKPKKPTVTILEGAEITREYDKNITLKCKVNAYPTPNVTWQDNLNSVYSSTIDPVDLPYEYMSTIKIEKVSKNVTIQCKAVNSLGEDNKYIAIKTKRNCFIEVLKFPKDTTFEYGSPAELNFKVNAFPLVNITCFKNGKQIKNNSDFEVSSDGSRVVIRQMRNELKGNYTVEAYNDVESINHEFKLDMSKVVPVIDKSISEYKARIRFNVNISCRILKSKPSPVMSWTFKPEGLKITIPLRETTETLHLYNVGLDHIGIYSCVAKNEFGRDFHKVNLQVGYPPTIKDNVIQVKILIKREVALKCNVDGYPLPTVRWLFNEVEINDRVKYKYNDHSLRFIGSKEDNGIFTCEAKNNLGEEKKLFNVTIYRPINIENYSECNLKYDVGSQMELPCHVTGYPKPKVQWTFYSRNPSIPPKLLRSDSTGHLSVKQIQVEDEGFYTCNANNVVESKNITYTITVRESVSILANPLGATSYDAVVGDLALRIPCNATGIPKPVVIWTMNGENIASGADSFNIEKDGSLIINHPTLDEDNIYTCRANNGFTNDSKTFAVNVKEYPQVDNVSETLILESGTAHHVECGLPHGYGDIVNWFKDGQFKATGELYFRNITQEDSGVYSCRVSTFMSAHTIHKKVTVGYKPYFKSEEVTNIDYIKGKDAYLNCFAYGEPKPQIIWRHNGNIMKISAMNTTYIFKMKPGDIGNYQCVVSNKFGNINRTFNIQYAKECLLDIENDFNIYQPLLLSRSRQWPDYKKINDFLRIPESTDLLFACPGNTVTYNREELGEYVKATCIDNSIFKIRDRNVDFSKLKCKEEIKSVAKRTNQRCFSGNTELLKVGFKLQRHILLGVYDVCIDKDNKTPLFTRHNLQQGFTGILPKQDLTFSGSKYLPFVFEDMYKCNLQLKLIYLVTGYKFNRPNKCCFKKRQLVSPADVTPGLSQVATYNYLNVIPQWSSCGTEALCLELTHIVNYIRNVKFNARERNEKIQNFKPILRNIHLQCATIITASVDILFDKKMIPTVSQDKFLRNDANKYRVIRMLETKFEAENFMVSQAMEDAKKTFQNWDEIERRIRSLVIFSKINLTVFTGSSYPMRLPGQTSNVFLSDRFKKFQQVPLYIWKVVQNTRDSSSLAIIQINVPNITLPEAISYMPCKDICDEVDWMKNDQWHNVDKGFTFCCSITEFAWYYGALFKGHDKVFKNKPLVSDHSLI